MLNRSFDLIEAADAEEFLKFRKPVEDITILKKGWLDKMREQKSESHATKDHFNSHLETVKYNDLEALKRKNRPFASGVEVEAYMKGDETVEGKNDRPYLEVRYAKNMSLQLKHSDKLFRLQRDHKKFTNEKYAKNLTSYLTNARKISNLVSNDLFDTISKITGRSVTETSETENTQTEQTEQQHTPSFKSGE